MTVNEAALVTDARLSEAIDIGDRMSQSLCGMSRPLPKEGPAREMFFKAVDLAYQDWQKFRGRAVRSLKEGG